MCAPGRGLKRVYLCTFTMTALGKCIPWRKGFHFSCMLIKYKYIIVHYLFVIVIFVLLHFVKV